MNSTPGIIKGDGAGQAGDVAAWLYSCYKYCTLASAAKKCFFKRLFSISFPETLSSTSMWNIKYIVIAFAAGGGICLCVVVCLCF